MARCEDCGCKVYGGHCVNCHEEIYIERQYHDLNQDVPPIIYDKAREQERNPSKTE